VSTADPRAPLLTGVSQYEVDFVVPRLGVDVPLGIDPFLLFKSRNKEYRDLHGILVGAFNSGIAALQRGSAADARRIFDFPEVPEIGLGYTQGSKRGSGVGTHLSELIIETLSGSPSLLERGVRHVEEMQLVSAGIGPDRISDIAANVFKRFLIEYTQRQCTLWKLPMKSAVPVSHIYEYSSQNWEDSYEDLPVSATDGAPILLVPRRLVRALPWINYDDFVRTEFRAYLSARVDMARRFRTNSQSSAKANVVTVTRRDVGLVERYIKTRERRSAEAQPALDYVDEDACKEAEALKTRLRSIPSGREQASDYQRLVLEVLNYLFNPELIGGEPEVRTIDGTERRDIVFTNDSDESFWDYLRNEHSSLLIMFETKNTAELELSAVNQTATYLGDRLGRLGIIVTRRPAPETVQRKIFAVWSDSAPNRKVILTLSDEHLSEMLDLRCRDGSPTQWIQRHYRKFRTAVQ
jgi:hypothetical protein